MAITALKQRLRAAFSRRNSTSSSLASDDLHHQRKRLKSSRPGSTRGGEERIEEDDNDDAVSGRSEAFLKLKESRREEEETRGEVEGKAKVKADGPDRLGSLLGGSCDLTTTSATTAINQPELQQQALPQLQLHTEPVESLGSAVLSALGQQEQDKAARRDEDELRGHERNESISTIADFPTPRTDSAPLLEEEKDVKQEENEAEQEDHRSKGEGEEQQASEASTTTTTRPAELPRRESLFPHQQTRSVKTFFDTEAQAEDIPSHGPATTSGNMVNRRIWVKRPGASATLVTIHEDDLVDDVRDMILRKYANSLGRSFDAPDVTLRVISRENRQDRTLGPEEPICRTVDAYFPGGQTIEEALVIDVPLRRTPKPSPRPATVHGYHEEERRPAEGGTDYFPPMPPALPSPHLPGAVSHHPILPHAMSVLTTGQVPTLPSPGSARRHHRMDRPRIGRQHTISPIMSSAQTIALQHDKTALPPASAPPSAPPLPTPPPAPQDIQIARVSTPPPRVSSPRPSRPKKKKSSAEHPSLPTGMLNGAVPPINVLIVEDNIINLRLLEAFMKRLKVRWQTAMNGREAVTKWRAGGFHLVLMDIQLPIMSGLEATKEIRRLERLNSIGVFSSSASSSAPGTSDDGGEGELKEEDRLSSKMMFKSPVIIVALTASSLQSDRHEALAAGCNDFLTKPVHFVWLERKVMEWGCMQALIDFDGWRKWKDFSQTNPDESAGTGAGSVTGKDGAGSGAKDGAGAGKDKKKRKSRSSLGGKQMMKDAGILGGGASGAGGGGGGEGEVEA